MVRCCVLQCRSDSEVKEPGLSFHAFPDNNNLRLLWIKATGRTNWAPRKFSRMCCKHFEKKFLIKKKSRSFLFPQAVPNLACSPSYTPQAMQRKLQSTTTQQSADQLKQLQALWEEGTEPVSGGEAEMEDDVPKVCRACLASEVRMFDVAAAGLQDTFEHVTGTKLYTSDERPTQVCFVCCSQLQRFRAFCQMSRRAETYMTKLLKKGLQITEQEVSKRHRLIKPKLDVKKNPLMSIHTLEDSNESATVEVKVEVENEEQDNNSSDSETESETEFGSEVKTGTYISDTDPERENETEERQPDFETEGEIKIEIDEIDIEEFDPFEAVEHTTVRDETCYCLKCAEAFPSQSELLKHVQNHTQKKLKQANSTKRNVQAKRIKRNVKTKLEMQCKFCNMTFAIKTKLAKHVATEHGFGEFSVAQKPKRRKPNILKKPSKHNAY